MSNPASLDDVQARWRPIPTEQGELVATRLNDAWRKLRRLLPDLQGRIDDDTDLRAETVRVLADAVIVLLENPLGHRRGTTSLDDGSYSWEVAADRARGEIHFPDSDLDALRSPGSRSRRARAFSVMPS